MTSRSVVLGTAALLLLSAAAPIQFGLSPTAAIAQEVSDELRAAFSGKPGQLSPEELRKHIRVLREAMDSGIFKEAGRKSAEQKIEAYTRALERHGDQRREAGEDTGQPRQGERATRQRAERNGERQAEQYQSGLSPEMLAALRDDRPASELDLAELRNRNRALISAMESGALTREQRRQVHDRLRADSDVMKARQDAQESRRADQQRRSDQQRRAEEPRREERADQGPRERRSEERRERRQRQAEEPRREERADQGPRERRGEERSERRRRQAGPGDVPQEQIRERARSIISDTRPARDLNDAELRRRLTENRAILGTGRMSEAEERELRQQLRQDREEMRARVARRQDNADRREARRERESPPRVDIIIEDRRPADQLSERDLERRVRALNRALEEERLARRDAERAREMVERDRRELRRRLHAERERRRERRREARSRNDVIIDFNIGQRTPQVIFAAEAMPHDIEAQLVAPPSRQLSRSYSVEEISRNHEVREAMPGIEIDTLNFDFGSAEVRPEEIEKLDEIAYVIERIVAARPDEVFLIEGHTDAVGSDAANEVLSQRRAHAVYDALLDYYAIDPHNLQTVGLGERFLKIWTEYPEEENRRVTIRRITPLLTGGRG